MDHDKLLNQAVTEEFAAAGYPDDQIKIVLDKQNRLKTEEPEVAWIKVHRQHLLPDTLITYRLPWDWDEVRDFPPQPHLGPTQVRGVTQDEHAGGWQLHHHQAMD
jgi:hypothetical protein